MDKKSISLICSDIDGTLLNKERQLSEKTISQIKKNNDKPFILISSRMPAALKHLQEELDITNLPIIAYNGGLIINQGKIISTTEIEHTITSNLVDFCSEKKLHISLYHNDEWYVDEYDYWADREANNTKVKPTVQAYATSIDLWEKENKGAHKLMVMGDADKIDELVKLITEKFDDQIIGYRSKDTYLEIAHKSISKKTAIKELIENVYPQFSFEQVMAFGDNYNDIEMLKAVGIGVAVANARPEVLEISNATTDKNIEDGVANFIESYFS